MTRTLRLKTNLDCKACVAAVKPYLDGDPAITRWEVDLGVPEKTLTVHGDSVSADGVAALVAKAGFQVIGEVDPGPSPSPPAPAAAEAAPRASYYPLFLLSAYLLGFVLVLELRAGDWVASRAMQNFMGAFFAAFAFFKLLDLRGFADAYRMYDIVARRFPAYGFAYPFIELALGAAYLTGFQPVATNLVTLVVMSVSSVGVARSLLARREIRCACLGTVFNLPMSTITLVEDSLMIAMAAVMLVLGPHGAPTTSNPATFDAKKESSVMGIHGNHHGHQGHAGAASLIVQADSIGEAGRPSTLRMMIHDAEGGMVRDFDVVHEQKVHLIIVREGLDAFGHVHPAVDASGNLAVSYTFPVGGTYRLFADYRAPGGEPAIARAVVRVRGSSPAAPALRPDVPGRVEGEGVQADVTIGRSGAGRDAKVRLELLDSDGRPVTNLRPYLGAMGHLVVISADGGEYVHAHPEDRDPADAPNAVVFHAEFPKPGLYKGWGQFRRGDDIATVPFVLEVR